ncbi:MAG: TolC family protein [Gemmatimonadota bacterium]
MTLAEALREARAANARLAVVGLDTAIARAGVREAKGQLWPDLTIEMDAHGGAPTRFASGDARLVMVGLVPLYDGGRLRSNVRAARARRAVAAAGYRIADRDLLHPAATGGHDGARDRPASASTRISAPASPRRAGATPRGTSGPGP